MSDKIGVLLEFYKSDVLDFCDEYEPTPDEIDKIVSRVEAYLQESLRDAISDAVIEVLNREG